MIEIKVARGDSRDDNRFDKPVEIFWLNADGGRQSYGKIPPGTRKDQHTFRGHVWLVANEQGETLGVFEATAARPALDLPKEPRR